MPEESAMTTAISTEGAVLRSTFSVCPVCLRKIPAEFERMGSDGVFMKKTCPEHGSFRIRVWADRFDLEDWIKREDPLSNEEAAACGLNCTSCTAHGQDTCCAILEVTNRCNLRCTYCFADGGRSVGSEQDPSFEDLCGAIDAIAIQGGGPLIQLSGGEPTLRDDLPELVRYALRAGCQYTQINTNGIRLAEDEDYVKRLAEAGLDIVFLQFDGTDDSIYRKLRGTDLLETKLKAINNCCRYDIGVTLVPTVVRGVNDTDMGNVLRLAAEVFPAVKAVHFQPVTYQGRFPKSGIIDHYTLDELMADLCEQTGIPEKALLHSRCDHAMCEFHSTFMVCRNRQLLPMTDRDHDVRRQRTAAAGNRRYVAEHWRRGHNSCNLTDLREPLVDFEAGMLRIPYKDSVPLVTSEKQDMDFDEFTRKMRTHTLKVSAMAFQDATNIDLERLYRCSLHIYQDGRLVPFCTKYLTAIGCR